jgi:hypothetical protein
MMDKLIPTAFAATPKPSLAALPTVSLGERFGLGHIKSLGDGISYLVGPAFAIAGIALLLYIVFGAFKLIFSGGDKTAVAAAREMITHAIIGVILLIAMFFILPFILSFFGIKIKLF